MDEQSLNVSVIAYQLLHNLCGRAYEDAEALLLPSNLKEEG